MAVPVHNRKVKNTCYYSDIYLQSHYIHALLGLDNIGSLLYNPKGITTFLFLCYPHIASLDITTAISSVNTIAMFSLNIITALTPLLSPPLSHLQLPVLSITQTCLCNNYNLPVPYTYLCHELICLTCQACYIFKIDAV